ncbi:MAG: glycerate kinase [Victivallales bacterium]|nr:glycerate kinase [Victivallales bacterium]
MKIVLAPDSFKGTLSALEVCAIEAETIREQLPEAQVVQLPLADGGEGTLEAIRHAQSDARRVECRIHDPLMREITAEFLRLPDGTAVIELAQASGLGRLQPQERNPLVANTFGTGELISHALKCDCQKLIVGLGGSATVDGGIGLAAALGVKFFDQFGTPLPQLPENLAQVRTLGQPAGLEEISLTIACDVTNPLVGPNGAATVFGPQKGATPEMVTVLEAGLANWAHLWNDEGNQPGDGAAGGVGFLLRKLFPHCQTISGGELLCELAGLDNQLADADLVITGEGASDAQTRNGKLPFIVGQHARNANVPCALLSGFLPQEAVPALKSHFQYLAGTLTETPEPQELTHDNCERRLCQATRQLIQTILDNS